MLQGKMRRQAAVGVVGVLALLGLAGCTGGSDSGSGSAKAEKSSGEASATTAAADGSSGTTTKAGGGGASATTVAETFKVTLGRTGWYDGFKITLVDLEAKPTSFGTSMVVTTALENLTDDSATAPMGEVIANGKVAPAQWDTPRVPGAGKANGKIEIEVDTGRTPLDKAGLDKLLSAMTVQFGQSKDNQTILPLGAGQSVTTFEPKKLPLTGKLQQGPLVVEVQSGGLQASYESGEKGKAELSMKIKISCSAECTSYGVNMDSDMLSVKAPDGSTTVADSRSPYCCDAIYPGRVSDNAKNVVIFVVPMPGTGAYTLTLKNPSLANDGVAPATLTFTV